jgi:hypothetical protein
MTTNLLLLDFVLTFEENETNPRRSNRTLHRRAEIANCVVVLGARFYAPWLPKWMKYEVWYEEPLDAYAVWFRRPMALSVRDRLLSQRKAAKLPA